MSGKTQLAAERSKMACALASMEKFRDPRTEDMLLRIAISHGLNVRRFEARKEADE